MYFDKANLIILISYQNYTLFSKLFIKCIKCLEFDQFEFIKTELIHFDLSNQNFISNKSNLIKNVICQINISLKVNNHFIFIV